jgi:uncharacterized protein YlaI
MTLNELLCRIFDHDWLEIENKPIRLYLCIRCNVWEVKR